MRIIQANTINHKGIITKISDNSVSVRLTDNVNCAACNLKTSCGVTDDNSKDIEIFENFNSYKLHETVVITMGNEMGLKAVFLAYVLPFILLFSTLIIGVFFLKEWQAGLLSIAILIPYYLIIYLLEKTLKKQFAIALHKHSDKNYSI